MASHSTTIGGVRVELETYTEGGEPRSDCFCFKGKKSCSLTLLLGFGCIDPDVDGPESQPVPVATIERIEAWALRNGY